MAFKKIDLDAVASKEPLDAFVTKGVQANNEAAFVHRARVGGKVWTGERPVYGCVTCHTFLPLAVPVSGRTRTVSVDWLVQATTPGSTKVYIRPVEYNPDRRRTYQEAIDADNALPAEEVVATVAPEVVTTTLQVSLAAVQRGVAYIGLHIWSDWDTATSTKANYSAPHPLGLLSESDGMLLLDEAGPSSTPWAGYSASKRYAVQITTHSSVSPEEPQTPPLDVMWCYTTVAGNFRAICSPTVFYDDRNLQGDFAVDWREIARIEFYGATAYEVVSDPADLLGLEQGYGPRWTTMGSLHADQHRIWRTSGSPRCISAQERPALLDVDGNTMSRHGMMVPCNDRTARSCGAALLLRSDTEGSVDISTPSATTVARLGYRVSGLVAVGSIRRISSRSLTVGSDIKLKVTAHTVARDGATGDWIDNPQTDLGEAEFIAGIQQPNYNHTGRGNRLDFTDYIAISYGAVAGVDESYQPVYHNLRGMWPTSAMGTNLIPNEQERFVTPGGCGLSEFEFDFEDEFVDDEERLLRLTLTGDFYSAKDHDRLFAGCWAYLTCWTVRPIDKAV